MKVVFPFRLNAVLNSINLLVLFHIPKREAPEVELVVELGHVYPG